MADASQDGDENQVSFRLARADDVPAIVAMLADDPLGAARESVGEPLDEGYRTAFEAVEASPDNELIVAESGGAVVGCLQLTIIPGLPRRGALRGQIESVRVGRDARGGGVGARMIDWALARARTRGCEIVQLTSDASRTDARQFYERLGFVASHIGLKRSV